MKKKSFLSLVLLVCFLYIFPLHIPVDATINGTAGGTTTITNDGCTGNMTCRADCGLPYRCITICNTQFCCPKTDICSFTPSSTPIPTVPLKLRPSATPNPTPTSSIMPTTIIAPPPPFSADFNKDGKVDLVDFEIWRNTMYK